MTWYNRYRQYVEADNPDERSQKYLLGKPSDGADNILIH